MGSEHEQLERNRQLRKSEDDNVKGWLGVAFLGGIALGYFIPEARLVGGYLCLFGFLGGILYAMVEEEGEEEEEAKEPGPVTLALRWVFRGLTGALKWSVAACAVLVAAVLVGDLDIRLSHTEIIIGLLVIIAINTASAKGDR